MTDQEQEVRPQDGEWWSFEKLERDLERFESLLADMCGLPLTLGKSLPKLMSALRDMIAVGRRQQEIDEKIDHHHRP